jgi:hypothetical protein
MLASAEVRWFFRGDPPVEVGEWFRSGDLWTQQPSRVDEYLMLPGCSTAGIKLREGRFEVKVQTEEPVATEYPGGVRGHRDGWVKWSRSVGDAERTRAFLRAGDEQWARVRKDRALRGFSLDQASHDEDPREIDAGGEPPGRGCGVEITEVRVLAPAESTWWTLGLEGFDDAGDPTECLERVARFFFAGTLPPVALDLDSSLSYAAWLGPGVWGTDR